MDAVPPYVAKNSTSISKVATLDALCVQTRSVHLSSCIRTWTPTTKDVSLKSLSATTNAERECCDKTFSSIKTSVSTSQSSAPIMTLDAKLRFFAKTTESISLRKTSIIPSCLLKAKRRRTNKLRTCKLKSLVCERTMTARCNGCMLKCK